MKRSTGKAAVSSSRWFAYSIAAVTTTSAGAGAVQAAIHYSGVVDLRLARVSSTNTVPLSNGANIQFRRGYSFDGAWEFLFVSNAKSAGICDESSSISSFEAVKLARHVRVSAAGNFGGDYGALVGLAGSGNFLTKGKGFIGFKFNTGKGVQYGWARIKTFRGGRDNAQELVDYAWADPGEPILTGQRSSDPQADAVTPASGSLGLLALGSVGLLAWKDRRLARP